MVIPNVIDKNRASVSTCIELFQKNNEINLPLTVTIISFSRKSSINALA